MDRAVLETGFDGRAQAARRERLARLLGDTPALVAAGRASPRNYTANTHPFRASSHFLYLFGLPLPGAYGFWDGQRWTLFARTPTVDDAIWNGPEASLDELAATTGCPTRSVDELPSALAGRKVASLPTSDRRTLAEQSRLLGRTIEPDQFDEVDLPLVDAMIALRLRHDDAAEAELRRAAAATAAAHRAGMRATRPGLRESDVRAAMEAELIARGMTVAYGSIVTVHGEVLHNEVHHHRLGERDLLLADVGAETESGWAGDVTRVWPVSGRFSATQAAFYDVVLTAQKATVAAVGPGVRHRDLHMLAARKMAEGLVDLGVLRGRAEDRVEDGTVFLLFPHGIGHLLGLDVHDMEDLGDRAGYAPDRQRSGDFGVKYLRLDRDLEPGMAVTIEPGLYIVPAILDHPDLGRKAVAEGRLDRARLDAFDDVRGIRIEDDVLVTAGGHDVLTVAIPKERTEVEAVIRLRT